MVVQTSWIKEVLQKQCLAKTVVLGKHILTPHFMVGLNLVNKSQSPDGDSNKTVKQTPPPTAPSLYTLYNSVWSKLEQDCSDYAPESESHEPQYNRTNTSVKQTPSLEYEP